MQSQAVDAGIDFFRHGKRGKNGIMVEPTAFGKSLVISNIAQQLEEPVLVFQPTREILMQNLDKFRDYGVEPTIYSAGLSQKDASGQVVLATIGSVAGTKKRVSKAELFQEFPNVIVDECHYVSAKGGGYKSFFDELGDVKLLGLSASPWRMASNSYGTEARFLTRTRPRVFHDVVHYTQIADMVREGYWAPLEHYSIKGFDRSKLELNSTGAEYDEKSVQRHLFEINFKDKLAEVVQRALKAGRRNVLVFTQFIPESQQLVETLSESGISAALVTGETPPKEREAISRDFQAGAISVVANAKVWVHGYDFPRLECVIDAAATLSLARLMQKDGRGVRIHPDKQSCWLVDMVQSFEQFGNIEDLKLYCSGETKWAMYGRPGGGREVPLTNVYLAGSATLPSCPRCKSTNIRYARHVDTKNQAMLSKPTEGIKANIVLKDNSANPTGQKLYAIVQVGSPEAEWVNHRSICAGSQRKAQTAAASAPWEGA